MLNLFSRFYFFAYNNDQGWFISLSDKTFPESRYGQKVYRQENSEINKIFSKDEFSKMSSDEIEHIPYVDYYRKIGTVGDNLSFPDIIDSLFDKYFSLHDDIREVFDKSVILFSHAHKILSVSSSIGYATFISAIENLVDYENKGLSIEHCRECGQPKYKVTKKFKDFMIKYTSGDAFYKKYAQKIYSQRSKILHAGDIFKTDITKANFDFRSSIEVMNLIETVRVCLINWLMKN